jgi:hypothetical protein
VLSQLIPKVASIVEQIKAALPPIPKATKSRYNFETKAYETIEVAEDDEDYMMDRYFDWDEQHKGELMILKGAFSTSFVLSCSSLTRPPSHRLKRHHPRPTSHRRPHRLLPSRHSNRPRLQPLNLRRPRSLRPRCLLCRLHWETSRRASEGGEGVELWGVEGRGEFS